MKYEILVGILIIIIFVAFIFIVAVNYRVDIYRYRNYMNIDCDYEVKDNAFDNYSGVFPGSRYAKDKEPIKC